MPQIAQITATYASQIFWLLLIFGLTYFVIGRGMVPRVESTVQKRDGQIAADLAAAEAARRQADATEAAWIVEMDAARAAAHAETTAAKQRATAAFEKQMHSADAELAERIGHHDLAIANAKAEALANLSTVAADVTQELVAKVAGLTVSIDTAADAVRRTTAHV